MTDASNAPISPAAPVVPAAPPAASPAADTSGGSNSVTDAPVPAPTDAPAPAPVPTAKVAAPTAKTSAPVAPATTTTTSAAPVSEAPVTAKVPVPMPSSSSGNGAPLPSVSTPTTNPPSAAYPDRTSLAPHKQTYVDEFGSMEKKAADKLGPAEIFGITAAVLIFVCVVGFCCGRRCARWCMKREMRHSAKEERAPFPLSDQDQELL